ncbi:MAG: ABC transporter ATP-binding protein [Verrucomicrobiia bacterium]
MNTPTLELSDVTFAYGRRAVLHEINLAVAAGEFVGLLGPNGSGKSTLLKLLYGHLQSAAGTVRLNGADLRTLAPREVARSIAVVPQESPDTFGFTVAERVLMGRHPFLGPFDFETEHDQTIAREAMLLTDTAQFAGRTLSEISGGERQRALIASALAQTPEILLLDEPTAMLDIRYQAQIISLLRRLNRERHMTIVITLHDVNLAALSCRRLVVLKAGRVVHDSTPQAVLTKERMADIYEVPLCRVEALLPQLEDERA